MKTYMLLFLPLFALQSMNAQDISADDLPPEVKEVLDQYIEILSNSETLDDCANNFVAVAGGGLVNEQGKTLRRSVKPYSLKKDWENVKFYAQPLVITRVQKGRLGSAGFGPSAVAGETYKIWIDKKEGVNGMPAPIQIIVPENHDFIDTPKVISIGSL